MHYEAFKIEMLRAESMHPEDPLYWSGYRRGLRRRYHGENFGTPEEHHMWNIFTRDDRGQGYRDGYKFKPFENYPG